ncbi:MAG TPA: uroporphyrinogen-III synthase [Abditibacteriaceae bacterium]|jgi:uroporphyrinogen-III synthase
MNTFDFDGLRVLSLESRRAEEMQRLIEKRNGVATVAPSMREVALESSPQLLQFKNALGAGEIDFTIWMTGVGTRMLARDFDSQMPREEWVSQIARTTIIARGPKPASALRELNLAPQYNVPEPNTWREILPLLDANSVVLKGRQIAVQEYGVPNRALEKALKARGATVMRVPVYRWALPENIAPLSSALDNLCDGKFDVVLFTAGTQAWHMFKLAYKQNREAEVRAALGKCVVASIGPTTSESLREFDLRIDFEPDHPKMGQLVNQTAQNAHALQLRLSGSFV